MATLVQGPTTKPGTKFSLKRVLLTVIVLVVILAGAAVGYWYYLQMQSTNPNSNNSYKSATNSASKSASATSSAIPNAKTYEAFFYDGNFDAGTKKGVEHTVTFSYPSSWSVGRNDTKNKNSGHYYTVTDPSGFKIELLELPGGVGGACPDFVLPKDLIIQTEAITLNNQALYLRYTGSIAKKTITQAYLANSNDYSCILDNYVSLNTPKNTINFSAVLSFPSDTDQDTFLNSLDVKTAKQVLKSIIVKN